MYTIFIIITADYKNFTEISDDLRLINIIVVYLLKNCLCIYIQIYCNI